MNFNQAVTMYCEDCRDVLPALGRVDHVVTDPPYSERTHTGHDSPKLKAKDGADRKALGYNAWTAADVDRVVPALCDIALGWVVVVMPDHVLELPIQSAMERSKRYAFAPLPSYVPGSRVRLAGDVPSS